MILIITFAFLFFFLFSKPQVLLFTFVIELNRIIAYFENIDLEDRAMGKTDQFNRDFFEKFPASSGPDHWAKDHSRIVEASFCSRNCRWFEALLQTSAGPGTRVLSPNRENAAFVRRFRETAAGQSRATE